MLLQQTIQPLGPFFKELFYVMVSLSVNTDIKKLETLLEAPYTDIWPRAWKHEENYIELYLNILNYIALHYIVIFYNTLHWTALCCNVL